MTLFGVLGLLFCLVVRPMEIVPALAQLKLLNVFTAIAALGVGIDVVTNKTRDLRSPQLPWLGAFVGWAFFATVTKLGLHDGWSTVWANIGLSAIFLAVVSSGARTFFRLRAVAAMMVLCLTVVASVALHQGLQPAQCIELPRIEGGPVDPAEDGVPDGRLCESDHACEEGGKPESDYLCERVGVFRTMSVGRRVRYRGQLADPNEMSVFIGAVLPLLFALGSFANKRITWLIALGITGVAIVSVVMSQSRSGQFVIATVFLAYFVRRFGWKGAILAALLSLPVMLLGGREGAEADASAQERATILYEGIDLLRAHPFLGVGVNQFGEEISIPFTAHNSYLLAPAELGIVGGVLWTGLMWMSLKIPLTIARTPPKELDPRVVPFASALSVAFMGMGVGVFFLSFCYKQILFLYAGMCGALYGVVRQSCPSFRVQTTRKDVSGVIVFSLVMIGVVFIVSRVATR